MKSTKLKKFIVNMLFTMVFLTNSSMSFAASGEKSFSLFPNYVWTSQSDNTDSRSGKYSTVYARNHAVRPLSGTDRFNIIHVRVTNGYGLVVSGVRALSESKSDNSEIEIEEGYLDIRIVGFQFRNFTADAAYVIVSYDGR